MSNNKYLAVLGVVIVFSILAISLTLASNEHSNNHTKDNKKNQTSNETNTNHTENETHKENKTMNYGRCVSNFTKVKNSCFKEVKEAQKLCVKSARNLTFIDENNVTVPANKTEVKNEITVCRVSYKEDLQLCKTEFKVSKETCGQYKCKKWEVFTNNTCVKTQ